MIRKSLRKKIKAVAIVASFAFISTALLFPVPLHSTEIGLLLPQKGVCYVTWEKDRFSSEYSDLSLQKLSDIGVEYISIVVTQYQEKHNSTKIFPNDQTPTDRSLRHAIKKAHQLGIKVMLKPHLDLVDKFDGTYWRADIGFASDKDWETWFKEYADFILHYARMAKRLDVELFCVGTELTFTTQKSDRWRALISEIRKTYPGKLVYAANWDNYKNVDFWDMLDFVGIDAYFPLSYTPDPSLEELIKGWDKWKCEIEAWQTTVNKPVIFTEIGYSSAPHAPAAPWKGGTHGNADPDLQARCYKSFFESIWGSPWLAGVYWWEWGTSTRAGGVNNRHFTPQNKPAEKVLSENFKNVRSVRSTA